MTQVLDQLARALSDRYRLDRELGAPDRPTVTRDWSPSGAHVLFDAGRGRTPRWRADGRELFFIAGSRLMAVPIGPDGSVGTPAFAGPFDTGLGNRTFETLPDGRRFITIEEGQSGEGFTLVQNWESMLRPARGTVP